MAVSGFGLIGGAVVMFVWRNRKQTVKVISQAGLKAKVWTCFLLNMKVSATWMNMYLLSLQSVQSPNAAATVSSCTAVFLTVSVRVCTVGWSVCSCYSISVLSFLFVWLSHAHFILNNSFPMFLYSSISVQLAMFLLVTSLLIFNHLLLQIFLCIFVLPLSSMTN